MPPNPDGPNHTQLRRIRWAVRATLTLGVIVSVAANILHARDTPIAQAIAAWPPLALLLTVELISRVPVHRRGLAAVRMLATGAIAGIAAWVSYWHMAGVAARYGETTGAAHLIPVSVDGLVVVASVSLVELAGRIRDAGPAAARPLAEPADPAPVIDMRPAETPDQSSTEIEPAPDAEPRRLTRAEIEAERAARRAVALAALADPDTDIADVAIDAGVSVGTVQRWIDEAAARARRPRGGPRKPAPAPEPAERELVGASVAGSDFPADPATQEVS